MFGHDGAPIHWHLSLPETKDNRNDGLASLHGALHYCHPQEAMNLPSAIIFPNVGVFKDNTVFHSPWQTNVDELK